MPTLVPARLSTTRNLVLAGCPISSSVSSPSRVFFSDSASNIATMQIQVDASIVAITSGVNDGGVSTTMKSYSSRSSA